MTGLGDGVTIGAGDTGVLVLTGCGDGLEDDGSIANATTETARAPRTAAGMPYRRTAERRGRGGGGDG
jgi:hypothetical protein